MTTELSKESESFEDLGLSSALLRTLGDLGYETPTPIQQQTIPSLLAGRDLIGQAQTGTGKTAAFSLPILERIDITRNAVQALVLVPTRELAIQVAEAIQTYARHIGRVRVAPIYGGDSIGKQIARLRGGIHVVVGTPGRVIDHLERGSLDLRAVQTVVLDEADEMLRMGFIDDVEWILSQAPPERQTVLFSATMPREIRRIADRHQKDPVNVEIRHSTMTVPTVEQFYFNLSEGQKLNALAQVLETEVVPQEAVIIFVRTKIGAADLSEKLQARGYECEALHGGMSQSQRESVIRRLVAGNVEIVVATDVAARGLDVEQITRVINYDIPNDPESYVHRVGRTGRAGREGRALLFVTPRESRMMRDIERYIGKRLIPGKLPSPSDVAAQRMASFKERLLKMLDDSALEAYLSLVEELAETSGRDITEIAAAAALMAHGGKPVAAAPAPAAAPRSERDMARLYLSVGRNNGVYPAQIVAAIANEAGVPGGLVGQIDIHDDCSFVDVPGRYEDSVIAALSETMIAGVRLSLRPANASDIAPRKPKKARGGDRVVGGGRKPGGKKADYDRGR